LWTRTPERYGCAHAMQNPEVSERQLKNTFMRKEFHFPCGETRIVQGYEPFALDELVRRGYRAEDVVTDRRDVPEVWWTSPDGSCHRYFVDIFIPAENRMIEVKSAYTAAKQGVCEKASACRDAGFEFEIWVYDRDGTRINELDTRSSSNRGGSTSARQITQRHVLVGITQTTRASPVPCFARLARDIWHAMWQRRRHTHSRGGKCLRINTLQKL
jgi:hypothetical protein